MLLLLAKVNLWLYFCLINFFLALIGWLLGYVTIWIKNIKMKFEFEKLFKLKCEVFLSRTKFQVDLKCWLSLGLSRRQSRFQVTQFGSNNQINLLIFSSQQRLGIQSPFGRHLINTLIFVLIIDLFYISSSIVLGNL